MSLKDDRPVPYVEENVRAYLELCGDWAFALDQNLIVVNSYKNSDLEEDTRHPADMLGIYFPDFLPEGCRARIKTLLGSCQMKGSAKFSTTYVDEASHYMELHAISLWVDGRFSGFKVLLRDTTRRLSGSWVPTNFHDEKALEQKAGRHRDDLAAQLRQQQLMAAISQDLSGEVDFDVAITQVLHMVGRYLDADRVVVVRFDPVAETLSCRYEYHSAYTTSALAAKQDVPFTKDSDFYQHLMSQPFNAVSNTAAMGEQASEEAAIKDEKAFIHYPIFVDGDVWGTFGVDFCRVPHEWTSGETSLLQTVVNTITAAIVRDRAENSLLQAHGLLENVVKNYPGIIWSCDTRFVCDLFAGQGVELLGYDPASYLGKNMLEVKRTGSGEDKIAKMMVQTFAQMKPQRLNVSRAGRYLTLTTTPVSDRKGKVIGLVGVSLDITDIHQMQQKLQKAIQEAEEANRAKTDFLSRMSHEIRTPMNAIIGMNTIARKTEDVDKIRYCLDKIRVSSDRLLGLINDILDMSKIEANKFELSENEFDFEQMLQNVCSVIDVRVADKKQDFIIDFGDVFGRNVIADELRLSQVMINLLSNAVKFTPEGGTITLRVRQRPVGTDKARFRFEVLDNGIGVAAAQQEKLFRSFEQADGSITRQYGGTGLGLAICKTIVDMMGGTIGMDSRPGSGSMFWFEADLAWGGEKTSRELPHELPYGDIKILVIDDSEDVCEYFTGVLENFSLGCDTALSGEEGLALVDAANAGREPYNLIFVDWMMPGMDGIETARLIKERVDEDVIVIMISVADYSEIQREAQAIGVDKFLAKPILPSVLFNSILEWMNTSLIREPHSADVSKMDWHGRRMLLVEDMEINREIIVAMLEETGLAIESAENGLEALAMYKAAPGKWDVVLMDLQMPEMDGLEATRQIRGFEQAGGLGRVPVLAMTANAFEKDVQDCLDAGMEGHIAKPVSLDDMLRKIDAVLR